MFLHKELHLEGGLVNFWKQMENLEHLCFNEDLAKVSVGISEMFPKPESTPCLECWLHNMLGALLSHRCVFDANI